jgi:hypothetical protein
MQIFVCSQCNCVDAVELAFVGDLPSDQALQKCTFCKTGTWHNYFSREPYDPEHDPVCNRPTGVALG